jgi:hypothetical protein
MANSFLYIERTTFQGSQNAEVNLEIKTIFQRSQNIEFHLDNKKNFQREVIALNFTLTKTFKYLCQKDSFQKADHQKYGLITLWKRLVSKILFYLSLNYPNLNLNYLQPKNK